MPITVPSSSRRRPHFALGALWLIVVAVLAVQTLGLLHGVAHAGRIGKALGDAQCAAVASLSSSTLRGAPHALTPPSRGSWLDAMFGGHGSKECDAFDQASHADVVGTIASIASFAPPSFERAFVHIAWHLAAQACGFLARGPPVVA